MFTHMPSRQKLTTALKRTAGLAIGLFVLVSSLPVPAWASSGVSQGFTTTEKNLVAGTVMGLKPGSNDTVVPAVSTQHYQLLGVVASQPLVALSNGSNQVQIVVSGPTEALVSTINGAIKAGDKITASPIKGVGMKATDSGQVVGTAQTDLTASSATKQTVTDKTGQRKTIEVGTIPLQVSVGYYAGEQDQSKLAAILPPFLLSAAGAIAGQEISALRVLISLVALLIGFAIAANMLQAGIRAGVTALGRNPLAKKSIRRELTDVCLTALGVLVLTLIVVYLILKP